MHSHTGYVTGVTGDGEQLRFESWAYERYRLGILEDPMLLQQFRRCVRFKLW